MPGPQSGRIADVRFIGPVVGRYALESRRARGRGVQVFACRLQSISATSVVASAPVTGSIEENVTTHFQPFGTLRGKIARHIDGGFCIDIDATSEERERLATRIDWYKKRTFAGLTDKRQHKRFMPRDPRSVLLLADGKLLPCLIIDISASGAAVSADVDPAVGSALAVGRVVARVVRLLEVGFAVQFVEEQASDEIEDMLHAPGDWERAMRATGSQLVAL